MSWKSIVCTGLLCVVASPALADPSLTIDLVRGLDGLADLVPAGEPNAGDWQWRVSVTPDPLLFTTTAEGTGGSVAIELGISVTGADLTGATRNETNFPNENFGDSPFAFGDADDGITISGNELFAALGSTFFTSGTAQEAFTFTTAGPRVGGPLSSTVQWLGAYDGANARARIAQANQNFDTLATGSGMLTKTATVGDIDLSGGQVGGADTVILGLSFTNPGAGPYIWTDGDLVRDFAVNSGDVVEYGIAFSNQLSGPMPIEIPEPGSVILLGLGALLVTMRRSMR